jgi:hypothetical protein
MLVRSDQQECMCRSVQQMTLADEQLEQHLTSTETPDFDFLWGIADMYKVRYTVLVAIAVVHFLLHVHKFSGTSEISSF